jgi:hypothetical protein
VQIPPSPSPTPSPTQSYRAPAQPSPTPSPQSSPSPSPTHIPSPSPSGDSGFVSSGAPGTKVFNPSVDSTWASYYSTATIELDDRSSAYIYFRYQDDSHTYICTVSQSNIQLIKMAPNTELTVLSSTTFSWVPRTDYNLTVGGKSTGTIGCGITPVGGNGNSMVAVTPVTDTTYATGTTAIQGFYKNFYATKIT